MFKYEGYEYTTKLIKNGMHIGRWEYEIYGCDAWGEHSVIREPDEWYMTEEDAVQEAKSHIDSLLSGER
jgi:hypothetical protein